MLRCWLLLGCAACLLSGLGCSRPQGGDASARAQAVAGHYGRSQAFTADVRIIVRPAQEVDGAIERGEMLSFSVSLWGTRDDRLRISCKKFNVPFLEAMIEADGSFIAVLVRDEALVEGNLRDIAEAVSRGDASGGAVFSELTTITDILRYGPLGRAGHWRWNEDQSRLRGVIAARDAKDAGAANWWWDVELRGNSVLSSSLLNHDLKPYFHLRFTHEQEFDRLIRAQGNHLEVAGDPSSYLFRLQRIAAVPSISASSLALNVPEWPRLGIDEFLNLLVQGEP
ncbi:MAG: hypothetical protein EA402_06670 [Planctomycetota bacterium]|nr:MAG: hypothetical protein EA402_06670 [Planctomycetota bacterium]